MQASSLNSAQPGKTSIHSKFQKPVNSRVDFSKLSWGTLRKYQYYFRVKNDDESRTERDKQAAIDVVQSHFEEIRIDPTKLVAKFLRIKKDEKNDLYNLRGGKPTRPRAGATLLNFGEGMLN